VKNGITSVDDLVVAHRDGRHHDKMDVTAMAQWDYLRRSPLRRPATASSPGRRGRSSSPDGAWARAVEIAVSPKPTTSAEFGDFGDKSGHQPSYLNEFNPRFAQRPSSPGAERRRYYVKPYEPCDDSECEEKLAALQKAYEELQGKFESAEEELKRVTKRAESAEDEVERLKAEREGLFTQDELDLQIQIAISEVEKRWLAERERLLQEQKDKRARDRAAAEDHEHGVEGHLQEIIDELREELRHVKDQKEHALAELRTEFEILMAQLRRELEEKHTAAMEIAVHETEDRLLAEYREKLARKKAKLQAARSEVTTDETEIARLLAEIESLEESLHICERESSQKDAKIDSRDVRITELLKKIAELEKKIAELTKPKPALGGKGGFVAKSEPKPAKKPEPKPAPKPEPKPAPKPEPKPEPKKRGDGTLFGATAGKNTWAQASGRQVQEEGGKEEGYRFGDATRSIFRGSIG